MINFFLKFWLGFVEIIKTLPARARIQIAFTIIIVFTSCYILVRIFIYQENILRINVDREIRLAEINQSQPDSTTFKQDRIFGKGQGINPKFGKTTPKGARATKK